jgi:hypothetical protein
VQGWRFARWAPLSGVVFAALWAVTIIFFLGDTPGDTDREIASFYEDEGNRDKQSVAWVLVALATLFFLWFLAELRIRLLAAEGEPARLTALAFGSGLVSAVLFLLSMTLWAATSFAHDEAEFSADPGTVRLLDSTGYVLWASAGSLSIPLVVAVSLIALKTRVFPVWLGWVGLVLALTLLIAFAFIPVLALFAWVALLGILMSWRPAGLRSEPAPMTPT